MNNLSLRQLRYFEALTRHGHFARAANACAISQPAMSTQIKALEVTLGAGLFERSARGVRLTAFGEQIALRVHDILRAIDDLGDFARSVQDRLTGHLRIGVIPTVAPYLLPAIVRDLKRHYPGLDLNVRETVTQNLIADLGEGVLDMAIVALPVSEPSLSELPLFSERFVLVRPAAQADWPVPTPAKLREMRLLLLEEGHCFRDQALSFCALGPGAPREWLNGSSLATLVQMVSAGIGVTVIPEMALTLETRFAAVATAYFEGTDPRRTIGMVWRKSNPLAGALTQMGDVIRTSAESVLSSGRDPDLYANQA